MKRKALKHPENKHKLCRRTKVHMTANSGQRQCKLQLDGTTREPRIKVEKHLMTRKVKWRGEEAPAGTRASVRNVCE